MEVLMDRLIAAHTPGIRIARSSGFRAVTHLPTASDVWHSPSKWPAGLSNQCLKDPTFNEVKLQRKGRKPILLIACRRDSPPRLTGPQLLPGSIIETALRDGRSASQAGGMIGLGYRQPSEQLSVSKLFNRYAGLDKKPCSLSFLNFSFKKH
ncbi:hypothetical protein CEXT_572591 [Caerostris extrusa]|uniref:Uncharacterized protein n=1 Tax=Caerostris extrusa TaxID=172846 RepID=A0AAV4P0W1_CAEEX|nr:hypothetical protein CEXT_572591 [Caerostris extrusa]